MTQMPDFSDWLAISNVKADYCRLLDTKQWDAWEELFTEDCRFDTSESGGSVVEGRKAMGALVRQSLAEAKTAHQVHSPQMTFDGPDAADVIWAMQDRVIKDAFDLTGFGHYHERYVRTGQGWRIASQRLTRLIVDIQPGPNA
ncbi:nuclear transport factor 2 family protein [Novosphingobium sp. M1R2S20]|uniref:Nuclear transport factor 2 family protein n=1 Tax=Novosphingobium rhizovicinum TaxID=3228928 RepID=A0ABV3R8D7_9SPHN